MNQSPGKVVIYGDLISSKNSKQIIKVGKFHKIIESKPAQKKRKDLRVQLSLPENRKAWGTPSEFPIFVHFAIARKTHGKFDYTNITQQVMDVMTELEYYPDDQAKYVVPVFHPYFKDKDNPRTLIWWEN